MTFLLHYDISFLCLTIFSSKFPFDSESGLFLMDHVSKRTSDTKRHQINGNVTLTPDALLKRINWFLTVLNSDLYTLYSLIFLDISCDSFKVTHVYNDFPHHFLFLLTIFPLVKRYFFFGSTCKE